MLATLWDPLRIPIIWDQSCVMKPIFRPGHWVLASYTCFSIHIAAATFAFWPRSQLPHQRDSFLFPFTSPEWAHPGSSLQILREKEEPGETRPCPGLASACPFDPEDIAWG